MKLYLAHPTDLRKYIRKIELEIEEETGVELYNPFYDAPGRDDIDDIDSGKKAVWEVENHVALVTKDLIGLMDCDGVVAYFSSKQFAVGTTCESWFCMSLQKPVFIISPDAGRHPWLRFIISNSGGRLFSSWDEFKAFLKRTLTH